MIKKQGNKYVLFSKDGSKKLGTFATRKEAQDREKEINAIKHSKAFLVEVPLTITKASLQEDGTMRWQAVASETSTDRMGEQTTLALFQDWVERAETGKQVNFLPPPRMPFLGVSHYPDLDGFGEAGTTEKMYIDGNRFKVSGIFYQDNDHPLGKALFEAVRTERDLINKGETIEQPIRISAAWWDLSHQHGDFTFTRKSLDDSCPMCAKGKPRTFLQGQVDHWASTRVPIQPNTSLALEEKADMTTKKEDAASIVGEELADELEGKAAKPVGKSEAEAEPALVVKADEETQETLTERAFGGATSIADAEAYIEAQELQHQMMSNFDMFMMVMDNIIYTDNPEIDKVEAITQAVKDFGNKVATLKANVADAYLLQPAGGQQTKGSIAAQGELIMSDEQQTTETQQPQPVQPAATGEQKTAGQILDDMIQEAIQNGKLDRTGKSEVIQKALTEYVGAVNAKLDAVAPPDPAEVIAKAFAPIADKLDLIISKIGQQPTGQPVQKSFVPGQPAINNPGQQQTAISPVTNQPSKLTDIIRRSVGINQ